MALRVKVVGPGAGSVTPALFPNGGPRLEGFTYFWMKNVTGFRSSDHCAGCLIGEYQKDWGPKMAIGRWRTLPWTAGSILYMCGVASPYRWANNFHLVVKVGGDETVEGELWTGGRVIVQGAAQIRFTDHAAKTLFPDRGKEFLTCRNFQFAAQQFGNPRAAADQVTVRKRLFRRR